MSWDAMTWGGADESATGRAGPALHPAAAGVLNLTGFAPAFWHLRRFRRATVYCVGTLVLLVLAVLVGDGAPWLWRALLAGWVLLAAVDGALIASRTAYRTLSGPMRTVPTIVGVVAVVAMLGGVVGYGSAGAAIGRSGVAAAGRGDCATAVSRYDLVTGFFGPAFRVDVPAAARERDRCAEYDVAVAAHEAGDPVTAESGYLAFRDAYPDSPLTPVVDDDLERLYREWAGYLVEQGQLEQAVDVYGRLVRETEPGAERNQAREVLAQTSMDRADELIAQVAAAPPDQVGGIVTDVVATLATVGGELSDTTATVRLPAARDALTGASRVAAAQGRPCDALPISVVLVAADQEPLAAVRDAAVADRPGFLLDCGIQRYVAGEFAPSVEPFDDLVAEFPQDPRAAQARSGAIAARVAEQSPAVPLPAPYSGDTPGGLVFTVYNDSPVERTVRMAGPTAHEFVLPACPTCRATYPPNAGPPCPSGPGVPSYQLRLPAGRYSIASQTASETGGAPLSFDTVATEAVCLYAVDAPGGGIPQQPS